MAEYTAATIVKVLRNVPLDSTYSDTIYFESIGAQTSYFEGKAKYTFGPTSYQRVNSSIASPRGPRSIRLPRVADDFYDCNYVMFQNASFGTKWFYGFITSVNYINPDNTEILYELDYYQTYAFDFTILPSFIEREHAETDTLYTNLMPEPFECTPDYCRTVPINSSPMEPCIVVCTSTTPGGETVEGEFTPANIYSGLGMHVFPANESGASSANGFIDSYATEGRLDGIVKVFMSPYYPNVNKSLEIIDIDTPSLNGYQPKNNKLYSYPYCCIRVDNNSGNYKDFKYENFCVYNVNEDGSITPQVIAPRFNIRYSIGTEPAIYMTPEFYEGMLADNNMFVMSITDFPVCAWSGNVYANWYTQNSMLMFLNAGQGLMNLPTQFVSAIANTYSGNLTGALNSTSSAMNSAFGPLRDIIEMNNRFRNQGESRGPNAISPSYGFLVGQLGFSFYKMSIKPELAKMIDSYFDMFGYATNQVKLPNLTSRESWNYVKTNDVIIEGSMPVEAMNNIKRMFNNGVRFWHGDFVGNYALTNRPLKDLQKAGENNA